MDEWLTNLPSSAFHSLSETAGPDAAAAAVDAMLFISSATGGSAGGIQSWLCSRYLEVVMAHMQTVSSMCMAEDSWIGGHTHDTKLVHVLFTSVLGLCIQVTRSNAV